MKYNFQNKISHLCPTYIKIVINIFNFDHTYVVSFETVFFLLESIQIWIFMVHIMSNIGTPRFFVIPTDMKYNFQNKMTTM